MTTEQEPLQVDDDWEIPSGFTGIIQNSISTKMWYLNGECHREDGPAIVFLNGENRWIKNGQLHREDGPAYECEDGDKIWYLNGAWIWRLKYCVVEPSLKADEERLNISNCFVIEKWLPSTTNDTFNGIPVTFSKVMTEHGIRYIPDLPGFHLE